MSYQIQDIIVASLNDEPLEVERAFDELMESRIAESILARKQQLAGNLVAEGEDEPDEDEDDEDTEFDDTDFEDIDDEDVDLGEIDLEDIDFDDIEGFDDDDD